jgi:hypothetical protein
VKPARLVGHRGTFYAERLVDCARVERPASTTLVKDVPRALRRTNSLLVPVSISSRFRAVLRLAAGLRAAFLLAAVIVSSW